jgi:hypothetical protein
MKEIVYKVKEVNGKKVAVRVIDWKGIAIDSAKKGYEIYSSKEFQFALKIVKAINWEPKAVIKVAF